MSASARGVTTGLAGSAAVLLVAAFSLTSAHARDERRLSKPRAPDVRVQPAAVGAAGQPQPAWLRRLLSRSDLEPPRKRS